VILKHASGDELLSVTPDKLRRETSPPPSAAFTALRSRLMPSSRNHSAPIIDVSDVDEVRRSAARPPELLLQPHMQPRAASYRHATQPPLITRVALTLPCACAPSRAQVGLHNKSARAAVERCSLRSRH
jgi:hypothetical protein